MSCVWLADVLAEKLMLLGMYLDTNGSVFITTECDAVGNVPGHKQQCFHYHRVRCCWECIWTQTAAFSLPQSVLLLGMYLGTDSSVFITRECNAVGNVPGAQTAAFSLPQSVMLLGLYPGHKQQRFHYHRV